MKVLSKDSFEDNGRVYTVQKYHDDSVTLTIDEPHRYGMGMSAEASEALGTLLAGGELTVQPHFTPGDLVRLINGKGHAASVDSLAVVQDPAFVRKPDYAGDGHWLRVKWIDDRSRNQSDGSYDPNVFEAVKQSDITAEDTASIIRRVVDKGR